MSKNKEMTLYFNTVREQLRNAKYPKKALITCVEDFKKVVCYDHVSAEYTDYYRKNANFISADCAMFDVDNSESEDESSWITPNDIQNAFSNVPFYVSYSRNHMKIKNGKKARPKFHVYFPCEKISAPSTYKELKEKICSYFPAFDQNAKDSARFFIGVEQPNVEYYSGNIIITEFMDSIKNNISKIPNNQFKSQKEVSTKIDIIPEGQRNSTLHKFALKVLTRNGNTSDKAYQLYIEESKKCSPSLEADEINTIWNSALNYYNSTIKNSADYIPPNEYNVSKSINSEFKPHVFTDVGQARLFSQMFSKQVRFSPATGFIFYNGKVWLENNLKVQGLVQDLTIKQLNEACSNLKKAQANENETYLNKDTANHSMAKINIKQAEQYRSFALQYQNTYRISATLKEIQPMLEINPEKLDFEAFKLNTPNGTVNLHTKETNPHNPDDFCTKITTKSPGNKGADIFSKFLSDITCKNKELEEYLQYIAGMIAVGKVFCENLIIAYGCGCNGKSTFFNLLSRVLGSYAGSISSDVLTTGRTRNKNYDCAELRGKRMIIASELEDETKLDTAIVKKLCSTDAISAEKKYKDPFSFIPSHTVILCTNHLPSVSALDNGTWRRLMVIPFNANITPTQDIKNFADYLYENAGEAVMSWIIEGAYKFIQAGYNMHQSNAVEQATNTYRNDNDWISAYVAERCEVNKAFVQPAGELYNDYCEYCKSTGNFVTTKSNLKKALEEKGFLHKRKNNGSYYLGLRLSSNASDFIIKNTFLPNVTDSDSKNEDFIDTDIEF